MSKTLVQIYKEAGRLSEDAGSVVGGYTSLGIGPAIGLLMALATPTRTTKEQDAVEEYGARNFLPGVGAYNQAKRFGYDAWGKDAKELRRLREIIEEKQKKKKR